MLTSLLVLVVSTALLFFYIQTFCERMIRREFSRAYCGDVIKAIHLEYPRLQDAILSKDLLAYSDVRLALRSDLATLEYLVKIADNGRWQLSLREKILFLYFRLLLLCLPIWYALKSGENQAVLKLVTILQFLANLVGERLVINTLCAPPPNFQS